MTKIRLELICNLTIFLVWRYCFAIHDVHIECQIWSKHFLSTMGTHATIRTPQEIWQVWLPVQWDRHGFSHWNHLSNFHNIGDTISMFQCPSASPSAGQWKRWFSKESTHLHWRWRNAMIIYHAVMIRLWRSVHSTYPAKSLIWINPSDALAPFSGSWGDNAAFFPLTKFSLGFRPLRPRFITEDKDIHPQTNLGFRNTSACRAHVLPQVSQLQSNGSFRCLPSS